jgi:hypothetical protein
MIARSFNASVVGGVLVASVLILASCSSGNSENSASPRVPTPSEELTGPTAAPEPPVADSSANEPEKTPEAPEGPLYIGNDASFDFLVDIRDNVPRRWRIDREALPTKQEVSSRVLPAMVNPERCAQLASFAEAGYLVQEGPLQYITDGDFEDEADDFIVVGQAPLGILEDIAAVISKCATFAISRQSPSVIDSTPTQDVMTYEVKAKTLDSGYMFIQFMADGVVQITDKNYACLSQGNRDCMYKRSVLGYRLIRQDGETLAVAGVTNSKTKGGSATRPLKVNDFLNDAQSILESLGETS